MSGLLPELAERDAAGGKAAIYAEIRRLGGVPMVALVFRHLATLPGGIEWMWNAVGPAWRQGRLQEAAWRIARAAPIEPIPGIPREVLAALGVDDEGEREIRTVLAAYNRANPENLLTVLCLQRLLGGSRAAAPLESRAWTPPEAPGALVPMVDVAHMPAAIARLYELVASHAEAGGPRVVQSLYRHLGHRPAFLALVVTLVRARLRDGSIDRGVEAIHAAMAREADVIVRGLSAPPAPAGVREPVERFGGGVIAQMIVVGRLLEDALGYDL